LPLPAFFDWRSLRTRSGVFVLAWSTDLFGLLYLCSRSPQAVSGSRSQCSPIAAIPTPTTADRSQDDTWRMPDSKDLTATLFRFMCFGPGSGEQPAQTFFSQGKLSGTTHTSIGQEAIAAALWATLDPQDICLQYPPVSTAISWPAGGPLAGLFAGDHGTRVRPFGRGRGGQPSTCTTKIFTPTAYRAAWPANAHRDGAGGKA